MKRLPILLLLCVLLCAGTAFADPLDLSAFTAEPGVAVNPDGSVTFTEADDQSGWGWFYFYDPAFYVDQNAISITFDYTLNIGINNEDYLVVVMDFYDYVFEVGGYNDSVESIASFSGDDVVIDLTPFQGSTIDLAFGFEANDGWLDSVAYVSDIQYNTTAAPVPEPTTILLLGTGIFGLAGVGRKKILKG